MSLGTSIVTDRSSSRSPAGAVPESLRRLACLSITHERVSNEQLGRIAPDDPAAVARRVTAADRITECVVLVTCNRVAVFASTRTDADVHDAVAAAREALDDPPGARTYTGLVVARHLARVACGLDSAVLGEDQILGQVSRTFDAARRAGLAGGVLSRVADAAVAVGRQARDETAINDGEVGYGSAICVAIRTALDRPPARVLLVGAGEMATTAATALERRWAPRVDVANRSPAPELPSTDGTVFPLADLGPAMAAADAVVTATGAAEPVISRAAVEHCRRGTPIVDVATPPDVSWAARTHPNVSVTDLDDIAARIRRNTRARREAIDAVETRIDDALERLVDSERENRAEDVLRALHSAAAQTRERELSRAMTRLQEGEADPETVFTEFASALTGQLLAEPTAALRAAARNGDGTTIAAAHRLFDLDADLDGKDGEGSEL